MQTGLRAAWTQSIADISAFGDTALMNRLGAILYGLAVATVVLLLARESLQPAIWLFQEYAGDTLVLAVTGWLIATLGPIALSICIWSAARRLKAPWLLHLAFLPMAFLISRQGALLFFHGVKASGEGSPEGFALSMASGLLVVALIAHIAALITLAIRAIMHRANGS